MSEKSTTAVVSNVLEISDLAAKVSVRLFALSRKIQDALKPIEALSKDIASTGAVLNQLGHQLKKDQDVRVGSTTLATSVEELVEECSSIFDSVDKALDGNNTGSNAILGLQHYVHVASLEPQLVLMETNLERLKTPLVLMLQVLIYAEQLKSRQDQSIIKEQQQLIKDLNEERKAHERRFQKLNGRGRTLSGRSGTSQAAEKRLPPTPQNRNSRSSNGEMAKASNRIWIRDESPGPADKSTRNSEPESARFRGRVRIPNRFDNSADEERSSILDMVTFLRSTGPDNPRTPRRSSEDTSARSAHTAASRPRYQARDPVIRGDSSDLINFFREGLPATEGVSAAPAPRGFTPARRVTAPMTPPLTGVDDEDQETSSPLPAHFAPVQTHARSQSVGLPSPLGSHPPVRQFDPSRPATTKWPPQAVLAWLEQNSFSEEWRDTFSALQIWGSDFVELESGQSIRKMLTVVYPQLAKVCSASDKGWDQARERAEGQRLRKLIRELPVEIKYEDGFSTRPGEKADFNGAGAEARGTTRISSKPDLASPTGRQRASTAPPQDTFLIDSVTEPPFRKRGAPASDHMTFLSELAEDEEQQQQQWYTPPRHRTAGSAIESLGPDSHHTRNDSEISDISTEWVRKWTVLSPEEIARGRDVAPALMI